MRLPSPLIHPPPPLGRALRRRHACTAALADAGAAGSG
ncbi:hypothetical protein QE400_002657 [Xanthomonas sacchari]|nr:hypothetical protein [Xanthomonas sacchari]